MIYHKRFWISIKKFSNDVNGNWDDVGLTGILFVGGDNGDGGGVDSAN